MRSNPIERKWRVTSQPNRRLGCIGSVSPMRENRAGQAPPLPSVTRHEKAGFPLSPHRCEAIVLPAFSNDSHCSRVSEETGRGKPRPYSVLHERRAAEKPRLRKDLGGAPCGFQGAGFGVLAFQYCVPEIGCTSQTLAGGASPAPTVCYTRGGRRKNRGSAKNWVARTLRVSRCGVWVLTFQYCVPEIGCTSQTLAGGASPAPTKCYTTRKSRLRSHRIDAK